MSFNPLTGIRSFLTYANLPRYLQRRLIGFNPLTGIRSFLTNAKRICFRRKRKN